MTMDTVLDEATLQQFKAGLRGALILPGDASYDAARTVWNGMIDKRPALIVRCAGAADVISAVQFARTHRLLVSVRGGGHNIPGNAVCDGGLMIDLSGMKSVRVDPMRRTARAEGGVTWGEFDHETQVFGLATTGGTDATTGIAGLTLGGGLGWLAGKYGLACDNLLSVDLVTADGRLLTASATDNAELFWGVRGGGGNFGIVTSFEYRLHPVGPVLAGLVMHPFEQAKDVLRFYRDFSRAIPDELNTVGLLTTSPDGVPVVAMAVCYNGAIAAGQEVLQPLRAFGTPLVDQIHPMPYTEIQRLVGAMVLAGRQNYIKSSFVTDISDAAIDTLVTHFTTVPSPLTVVGFQQLGNTANRARADATAFSHREARYELLMHSIWLEPADSARNVQWTRTLAETMHPFTTGRPYVNQMGIEAEEGADRIKAAYGPNYERLVALKNTYDPTNLFRHNQNIKPTA
ncbi:MAG: FAD-binding oxidoreductase [Candidatus Entotheonellia bacterium]